MTQVTTKRGKFIVFEGTDGCGKSTQMRMLEKYLTGMGVECYTTHEPTDSLFGAQLRACMSGRLDADERAIAALFAADRLDHITNSVNGIMGKLDAGVTVLCDRYYLSSFAYNSGAAPLEWVIGLNRLAMEMLPPDLTVYIDVPVEVSARRLGRRNERERYETQEKQLTVHKTYLQLFERFRETEHIEIVKSEANKEDTQKHIREIVNGLFGF